MKKPFHVWLYSESSHGLFSTRRQCVIALLVLIPAFAYCVCKLIQSM